MESGETGEKKVASHEVVVMIPGTEENSVESERISESVSKIIRVKPPKIEVSKQESFTSNIQMTTYSPGIENNPIPGLNKPPKPSTETSFRRRLPASSVYPKPKSRIVESPQAQSSTIKLVEDNVNTVPAGSGSRNSSGIVSPSSKISTPRETARKSPIPITPRTPLVVSRGGEDDDDEDDGEVYMTGSLLNDEKKKKSKKIKVMILIEYIFFFSILGVLIASVTIDKFTRAHIWELRVWKWCLLALVICCGRLFTGWFTNFLAFLIERNFLLQKKVLYFLYGVRESVRVFLWLGLILLAWGLLINRGVDRSDDTEKAFNKITRGIACTLAGSALWMVKTFLMKLLAASFHVRTFFDRIQESIFHQYVLQTLSGPPLMEYEDKIGSSRVSGQLNISTAKKGKQTEKGEELIDVEKLHKINREKVSAWTMSGLIKAISGSGLSTISGSLGDVDYDEEADQKEIQNELEAKDEAKRIFKNVAMHGKKYIEEEDLMRFLPKEQVDDVLRLFEGTAEKRVTKSSFKNWVVNVYNERKCLALSLNDTKTAIEELNRIASALVFVVIFIAWLMLMGITTTEVLVFISSQMLLFVFIFGNTIKTVFEGIIFTFVVHPFDVGDRCVIDGIEMVVEEMNLLTTIFLRNDIEKIYYPNSVLASKPISNFNRSPEMADSVEFAVDFSTSVENVAALKPKIKEYLEGKPKHWRPNHTVQVKESEDVNKMKMVLSVNHTMNYQNSSERNNRRSDLVFELKKIFEELGIEYRLLKG